MNPGQESVRQGYRRRILIEPGQGETMAELEDDYHRMAVTLRHDANGIITTVESIMKRSPWTTCPGAMVQLEATFLGKSLRHAAAREEKSLNCTHLFDLASFAAAHAGEDGPVAYECEVSDPADGQVRAQLWRNGERLLDWTVASWRFLAPPELADTDFHAIGRWLAQQAPALQEAGKVLRWATMIASGRAIAMPAGMPATHFANGACYTFQPEMAAIGTRRAGADIDFTALGTQPMADREDAFIRR